MNITYKSKITPEEVNAIRKSMGWRQLHPDQLQANINAYTYIISAYAGESPIAMFGLEWNGGSFATMTIYTNPVYRNKGIEEECIPPMLEFLQSKLKPGYGIQVGIGVESGQEPLYEDMGFAPCTPQNSPIPMRICLTNQVELTDKMFSQMEYKKT